MNALKVLGATILTILLTIVLTSGLIVMTLNRGMSPENIGVVLRENTDLVDDFLREEIMDMMDEFILFEEVEDILDLDVMHELFIDLMVGLFDYLLMGGPIPQFTAEEINALVRPEIIEGFTDEERELWTEEVNKILEELNADIQETVIADGQLTEDAEMFALFFDQRTKNILIGLVAVLAGLIALVLFSPYKPFAWIGTGVLVAGSIMFMFGTLLTREFSDVEPLVETIMRVILEEATTIGLVTMIIGGLLIILYFPLKNKFNNNRNIDQKLEESFN